MSKLTKDDSEKIRAAAMKAILAFMPDVTVLEPNQRATSNAKTPPLSTGQTAEVEVHVLPVVEIEPFGPKASDLEIATRFYSAYNDQGPNPWRSWDGKPVPAFSQVGGQVREKWLAVARAARRIFG